MGTDYRRPDEHRYRGPGPGQRYRKAEKNAVDGVPFDVQAAMFVRQETNR